MPGAAPGLQHRDAVHLGKAEIEHDRVVRLALAEKMTFLAVEGAIDGIARIGQRRAKLAVEIGIVLDDQKAHGLKTTPRSGGSMPFAGEVSA